MAPSLPSLVVAAHGSQSQEWMARVREFADHVIDSPGVGVAFSRVEAAFLEVASPSITDTVTRHLAMGSPRVLVAPLFVTVSTHVGEDLPALLGAPGPTHVRRRLMAEGHLPLAPGLPVTLLRLGPLEALLARNTLRRLDLRTRDRTREAVVLCAYGSAVHHDQWERMLGRVRELVMHAGYAYTCHSYVGHVASMSHEPTRDAILSARRMAGVRRVHVIPLLLGPGRLQGEVIATACQEAYEGWRDVEIVYACDAVLPDGDLAAHVGMVALRELGVFPTADRGASA